MEGVFLFNFYDPLTNNEKWCKNKIVCSRNWSFKKNNQKNCDILKWINLAFSCKTYTNHLCFIYKLEINYFYSVEIVQAYSEVWALSYNFPSIYSSKKRCLVWWVFQRVRSEFGINNMKAWIQPAFNKRFSWCCWCWFNGVEDIFFVFPSSDGHIQQDNTHITKLNWFLEHDSESLNSPATRSQSNRAALGCGGTGDSHHGLQLTNRQQPNDVIMSIMFPAPLWIYATKNEGSS